MKSLFVKILASYAIVARGFDQTNLVGSVGGVTYRRVGGETIASQKVPPKQTWLPTWALMYRRMLWPNLVSLFRLINVVGWHPSFMGKAPRVSDFNAFMARNVSDASTRVFLTRDVVNSGGVVVAPVCISSGNLPPISATFSEENDTMVLGLLCGALNIGASTTIGAFSRAVIAANSGIMNGDQLTFVRLLQSEDPISGVPKVTASLLKIVLDIESGDMVQELPNGFLISSLDGAVTINLSGFGGGACIHSRDVAGGETAVSTQSLVLSVPIDTKYTSLQAFESAAMSYGGVRAAQYLTPRSGSDEVFPQS